MYLSALLLPAVFGGLKRGLPVGIITLLFAWFLSTHLLVTEIKRAEESKTVYATTWGTLIAQEGYEPGDLLSGKFHKQKYASAKEGRFARGYFIADRVESVSSLPVAKYFLKKRETLADSLYQLSAGRAFLSQALVLGDRRYMPDYVSDMFAVTGLGHLLSVSGLHAGLYGGIIFLLFFFLPPKIRLVPVILFMLVLIPFTGFKVTVSRAGLFAFAVLTAKLLDYRTDVRKLLLFMAGIFILSTPSIAADISFILSFSAVYGLAHLAYSQGIWSGVSAGMVASVFIMPAAAFVFGMFNVTSVVSTVLLVPLVTAQMIVFMIFILFPKYSAAPVELLDTIHLRIVEFFAENTSAFYQIYKPDIYVIIFMILFLLYCGYKRRVMAACVLLLVPYLPAEQMEIVRPKVGSVEKVMMAGHGAYFPKMVRSKGFVVIDDRVHVFFQGSYGDFKYKFLPFLAEKGVVKADIGTVKLYKGENRLLYIKEQKPDYGGVCVNDVDEKCKAVYHTKSNTYKCDDEGRVHLLYNNKKECKNMYLLKITGDLTFDEDSYKLR